MDLVVAFADDGSVEVAGLEDGREEGRHRIPEADLPAWVAAQPRTTRWVWADSAAVYPSLLTAGVRVRSAVDLRLVRAVLRGAAAVAGTAYAQAAPTHWDERELDTDVHHDHRPDDVALFELPSRGPDLEASVAEHLAQQECLAQARDRGGLALPLPRGVGGRPHRPGA